MDAATYDAWYRTPRGGWIGEVEYRLLHRMLAPAPDATLLDVGCGTGYFTRRFAQDAGLHVTGLDPNREWLDYARAHGGPNETYIAGDALELPFPDASFDFVVSITALCFIHDQRRALQQILRVARRRFALGLLNRHSILYRQKGRGGGTGAYQGAHWHTMTEIHALFRGLAVRDVFVRTAVFVPSAGAIARIIEPLAPNALPWGAFIAVAASRSAANAHAISAP
jgi:ubiquinone/menaquinone biosynthesis C-methylase UbiE